MSRWPSHTVPERILAHVDLDELTGCLLWTGNIHPKYGYGRLCVDRVVKLAHRVAYEAFVGPIPEGLTLDHLCRVRRCVNPAHLEPVTLAENKARGMSFAAVNARKTRCSQGHEFTPENTYVDTKTGWRQCATCVRDRQRRYYRDRRAA